MKYTLHGTIEEIQEQINSIRATPNKKGICLTCNKHWVKHKADNKCPYINNDDDYFKSSLKDGCGNNYTVYCKDSCKEGCK